MPESKLSKAIASRTIRSSRSPAVGDAFGKGSFLLQCKMSRKSRIQILSFLFDSSQFSPGEEVSVRQYEEEENALKA